MTPATAALADIAIASEPIPESDSLYEVVDGQIVEQSPMGTYECWIAAMLDQLLGPFARTHQLGRVAPETLFRIDPTANLQRRPDVAFVSYERWPRDRSIPKTAAWDVVPDLAIEIVSPTNTAVDLLILGDDFFRAGVRLFWVIYPNQGRVYLFEDDIASD